MEYKWIVLANTTLGVLMSAINGSILLVSLPMVFRGLNINPATSSGETGMLLWILLSFNIATTVFLVAFGRLSDSYGRVRLYNLGFVIFTTGSILASFFPLAGIPGEIKLIIARFIQGIGGAFLFANSAAILTDAFPPEERGLALGLNQVAGIGGGALGLVIGGLLSPFNWQMIFLVSVPFGILGSIWAYLMLKETSSPVGTKKIDVLGNLTFGLGLLGILLALTYGILPYKGAQTGWGNPFVLAALIGGAALLLLFIPIENKVKDPMFNLKLFNIRAFAAGNAAGFLSSVARGGLQLLIILWLQGVWLPLHGVSFSLVPLRAGIDTLPQIAGFFIAGPASGWLSDKYGARWLGFMGMVTSAVGFMLLARLPVDFGYWSFAADIFVVGIGQGLFAAPNTAAIMNSVPEKYRGAASGMRSTLQNDGMAISIGLFFTIVITGLSYSLPTAINQALTENGINGTAAQAISKISPEALVFASLIGYNPAKQTVPAEDLKNIAAGKRNAVSGDRFFPSVMAKPFSKSLEKAFWFSAILSALAAIFSLLRGKMYVWEKENKP